MARSSRWRLNKSSIPAIEGAQILKALQKVAGAAGLPKGYNVRFATSGRGAGVDLHDKEVVIGGGRLFTESPIPPENLDVLVGLTLHEVGHERIGTKNVVDKITDMMRPIPLPGARQTFPQFLITDPEKKLFEKFMNIAEDVVVESRTLNNPNLSDYEKSLFNWAVPQMKAADKYKLLDLWIEYALGHKAESLFDLPKEMDAPMGQLAALTGWLRHTHSYIERIDAYRNYWAAIKEMVLNPPKPPPPPKPDPPPDPLEPEESEGKPPVDNDNTNSEPCEDGEPGTEQGGNGEPGKDESGDEDALELGTDSEDGDEAEDDEPDNSDLDETEGEPGGSDSLDGDSSDSDSDSDLERPLTNQDSDAISDELAEQIEAALADDSEDVTDEVKAELLERNPRQQRVMPIIRTRETNSPTIKPNRELSKKLERVMTIRRRLQTRVMHGEQYGKIDKRHLHRAATDERIFSLRYKFPDGFPSTRILIDLSGSMSGRQANEVLEAAGALQVLVNAEVWCYDENDNKVNLTRMDDGKLIHRFEPRGSTPSGLAMLGVAIGMKPGGLIIHLTDGQHNSGQEPWAAHWILQKKGIELVNLLWGNTTRHYDYNGMNQTKLDGLADFPDALYKILVEQVKLAKMGGK